MPRYRALGPLYLRRLIVAGEEFESDLPPGRNWQPLDAEAEAAVEQYRAEKGQVLEIADRLNPRVTDKQAVEIPAEWQGLSWPKRRVLAMQLGAQSNVKSADANSFITAELERRAQKSA